MKRSILFTLSLLFLTFTLFSCSQNDDEGVIIEGVVINESTRTPIQNALVQVSSPDEFSNVFTRTDSAGSYSLGTIEITEVTDLVIVVSAPNFQESSKTLKVAPDDQINDFNFELTTGDSDDDDDGGTDEPSGPSGGAASIELSEISEETINIAATGSNTSTRFTFVVRDSLGNSLDALNATEVDFSIISGPGGGESINPTTANTNENGEVTAILESGNTAGVVQIEARIERTIEKRKPQISAQTADDFTNKTLQFSSSQNSFGTDESNSVEPDNDQNQRKQNTELETIVITSKPVAVTIHGGFPDPDNSSISTSNVNYEYLQELRVPISVFLGDEFSNPVKPGTAVYFETSAGLISGSAEGNTNEEGSATVNLNPAGTGAVTVTATTVDKNSQEFSKSVDLLFTTPNASVDAPEEIILAGGSNTSITFEVTDRNANPMAKGTTIEVTSGDSLALSGDVSVTLSDEAEAGDGITSFDLNIQADDEFTGSENITILVTSPSGVTTTVTIVVLSSSDVVPGDPEEPESMELISLSDETINIAESGGTTNTTFTFQVQDAAGRNLDTESAVDVAFSILSNPGGANITPDTAKTNAQGRVTSNLNAGNTAGVVQIQALVVGTSIKSEPVAVAIHGGFPDESNFSLSSNSVNYELSDELRVPINALLGDQFSNPVKPGTAVYFETDNGVIVGSSEGHTDNEGQASVSLNPATLGTGTITATTVDSEKQEISSRLNLLFTTSKADITTDFNESELVLSPGGNQTVSFNVTDKDGNPMAAGTSISVTTETLALEVSGNTSQTIEDALTGGNQITDFSFTISAGQSFRGNSNVVIRVTSPSGVVTNQSIVVSAEGGIVSGDPEAPGSMELITLSDETINIAESGGKTSSTFTFQVQDSAGRNLDSESAVDIAFSILSNPGGASITPDTVTTNAQGRATSNLNAGNTSGVVQIQAQVAGTNIISQPVAVTIEGGFPDQDHFTLEPLTSTNIEGFDRNGVTINYKVRAGDEFSNPVKTGTAIYFESSGGVIEGSGTGHTDETGLTEVTLFAGNPRPANGQGFVYASTAGKDGEAIRDSSRFIFSTSKATITPEVDELTLSPGSRYDNITYTVTDENGNPMAAGTNIEVTSSNDQLDLTGNTSITLTNELETGKGITDFAFSINAPDNFEGSETVSISVTSPSGIVTRNEDLIVSSTGGGVSGPPAGAAAIILETVQNESINIKETGGVVNTSFTFQVQDSSGRPLDMNNPVDVDFEIINGPGGGEGILPETATTNSTGRVTSNLFSGNTAGVVMLQATVTRSDIGLTLRSKPVAITIHGGFPDLDHFSIRPVNDNFGGYDRNGIENTVEVIVGDKFSNPVKPGTAVYFETTGGVIEGSGIGHTDEQGRVSVQLISADPRPDDQTTVDGASMNGRDGLATVTAKTVNEDNQLITKSANVIFSTNSAQISASPTTFDLDPNGGASFDYTVTDLNGNPMPAGTQFAIETGDGIEVTGSGNFTLGDHILPGPGATEFSFSIRDTDDENDDPADMTILIEVTSPNGNVTTYDGISGTRRKSPNR
jgi:hypothetical protein